MRYAKGTLIEVEIDHRKITYAEFVKLVSELSGRIVSRDGFWPLSKYKVLIPKKNARELLRLVQEVQQSEAEAQTSGS